MVTSLNILLRLQESRDGSKTKEGRGGKKEKGRRRKETEGIIYNQRKQCMLWVPQQQY